MKETIIIHEFSTGIEILGTPDNWYVGNFTGNYINSTLDSIPSSVKDAISGGYFKIAEGKSSSKPAVVGREISNIIEQWSVIVVVTKGKEKSGRTGSLYRYFVTEGLGNISQILQWMYQEKSGLLVFDPFDEQKIGYPHEYVTSPSNSNLDAAIIKLNNSLIMLDSTIIVPSHEACSPKILNEMANRFFQPPISWAFHVTGLDKPKSFQIIQATDYDSEETIKQVISKTPKQKQFYGQERAALIALKNITNNNIFKPQYLRTIEEELTNNTLSEDDWEDIFNQLGAKQELKDKSYAPSMIRLLTLRAMVLPGTLPEFITWIEQTSNSEHYDISSIFQSEVYNHRINCQLVDLRQSIIDGVKYIISQLVQKSELVESTVKLLTDEKGIWKYYYKKEVMPALDRDFQKISQYYSYQESNPPYEILNHPRWQGIYDRLKNFWQKHVPRYQISEYQPLADFFAQANQVNKTRRELRLYALFLYISQGIIPNSLFKKLKKNLTNPQVARGLYIDVYGLWIERQVPLQEKLYVAALQIIGKISDLLQQLWKSKIPFPWLILIMSIYTPAIFGINSARKKISLPSIPKFNMPSINIGWFNNRPEENNPEREKDNHTPNNLTGTTTSGENTPNLQPTEANASNLSNIIIPENKMIEAYTEFAQTKEVIQKDIFSQLRSDYDNVNNQSGSPSDPQALEQEIKTAIRNTLDPKNKLNLQYSLAIDEQDRNKNGEQKYKQEAEKWVKAIYAYQQQKKQQGVEINVEGYLISGGQTNEPLRKDVRNNISPEFKSR